MDFYIETERLIIREILESDEQGMFELDSNPEVHRYLGKNPVKDISQIRDVIKHIRQQYVDNGIGRCAMIEKSSGHFIGWTGLKLMREEVNGHINHYDLGYRLIQQYWGKGYATESAKAVLKQGFENMQLDKIYAMTELGNIASTGVLLKLGLAMVGLTTYDGQPHNWFEISKMEWLKSNSGA